MVDDIRSDLIQRLKELHLPMIRESFEEVARLAEQESLSSDIITNKDFSQAILCTTPLLKFS